MFSKSLCISVPRTYCQCSLVKILLKRDYFNENRSVPYKLVTDSEYSVIKSDVIKSFDCTIKM